MIVFGTEVRERAVGAAAAKKLLGGWKKLTFELDGKSTELRTKTHGYAAATVNWVRKGKPPVAMRATVFAVPGATERGRSSRCTIRSRTAAGSSSDQGFGARGAANGSNFGLSGGFTGGAGEGVVAVVAGGFGGRARTGGRTGGRVGGFAAT